MRKRTDVVYRWTRFKQMRETLWLQRYYYEKFYGKDRPEVCLRYINKARAVWGFK